MILFLDFDGVTHPEAGDDVFCCLSPLWKVLRACPSVEVVFSTSWRETYPIEELIGFVTSNGGEDLSDRFIGVTPKLAREPLADDYRSRELECLAWIDANYPGRSWLALDDIEYWFSNDCNSLYLVDYINGLTDEDSQKIIGRLEETRYRDWLIERTPKRFSGDKFSKMVERFPARVDCCDGMLGENHQQRLLMLAMLIENIGVDEVVKIGPLRLWIDAVNAEAAREFK